MLADPKQQPTIAVGCRSSARPIDVDLQPRSHTDISRGTFPSSARHHSIRSTTAASQSTGQIVSCSLSHLRCHATVRLSVALPRVVKHFHHLYYHDLDAYGNPCVGSGMTTATELFEKLERNVQRLVVYKDAIRACLDIGIEFTDIEQARDYIRCNVFDPLRNGLKYAFGLEFGALAPKVCSIPDQPKTSGDSGVEPVATQGSFFDLDYLPSAMAPIL